MMKRILILLSFTFTLLISHTVYAWGGSPWDYVNMLQNKISAAQNRLSVVNDAKIIYKQYQQLQTMLTQLKQYKTKLRLAKSMFKQKARSAFFDGSDAAQRELEEYRSQVDKEQGKVWALNVYQTRTGDTRMAKARHLLQMEVRKNHKLILKFIDKDLPRLVKALDAADKMALEATQGPDKEKNLASRQTAMLQYQMVSARINIKMMTLMHYIMRAQMIDQRLKVEINKDRYGTNKPEG